MRALPVLIVVAIGLGVFGAAPAAAQNVKAHKGAAERAIVKERWCEALFLYAKLDEVDPKPEHLLAAAEAAQFADDRSRALTYFKLFLERAPKHPKARTAKQSFAAIEKAVQRSGNGTACKVPTPECGNGVVEEKETCDDGNRSSGDSCPGTCTGTSGGPAGKSTLPPVGPVVLGPPAVIPPGVTPPVVTPPVVTTPPATTTTKPDPKTTPPATTTTPTTPTEAAATPGEICTLIKSVKAFMKGEWKTLEFGSTILLKSRGPQWVMIETPNGDGKVAASSMDGACKSNEKPVLEPDEPAPPTVKEPEPTTTPATTAEPVTTEPEPSTTEPEPAVTTTEPEPTTTEPVVTEPEPTAPPETKTLEPLRGEEDPAATAPEVEEGGGGLGGWIMMGVGAALAIGGGAAAAVGTTPYFEYTRLCGASFGSTDCPRLAQLGNDYRAETDEEERAQLANEAAELRADVDNAAQAWDEGGGGGAVPTGRILLATGGGAAGLGVALAVVGIIWGVSAGGEPDEEEEEAE